MCPAPKESFQRQTDDKSEFYWHRYQLLGVLSCLEASIPHSEKLLWVRRAVKKRRHRKDSIPHHGFPLAARLIRELEYTNSDLCPETSTCLCQEGDYYKTVCNRRFRICPRISTPLSTRVYKKAQLTQGLRATAHYARQRRNSKMAVSRHLGYYRNGNSAVQPADHENPC